MASFIKVKHFGQRNLRICNLYPMRYFSGTESKAALNASKGNCSDSFLTRA